MAPKTQHGIRSILIDPSVNHCSLYTLWSGDWLFDWRINHVKAFNTINIGHLPNALMHASATLAPACTATLASNFGFLKSQSSSSLPIFFSRGFFPNIFFFLLQLQITSQISSPLFLCWRSSVKLWMMLTKKLRGSHDQYYESHWIYFEWYIWFTCKFYIFMIAYRLEEINNYNWGEIYLLWLYRQLFKTINFDIIQITRLYFKYVSLNMYMRTNYSSIADNNYPYTISWYSSRL